MKRNMDRDHYDKNGNNVSKVCKSVMPILVSFRIFEMSDTSLYSPFTMHIFMLQEHCTSVWLINSVCFIYEL